MKYSDIGHKLDGSAMVWIVKDGDLEYRRSNHGTHETLYGPDYINCWRGRLDLITKQVSVKAPANDATADLCPPEIFKLLQLYFGGSIKEIINFGHGEESL